MISNIGIIDCHKQIKFSLHFISVSTVVGIVDESSTAPSTFADRTTNGVTHCRGGVVETQAVTSPRRILESINSRGPVNTPNQIVHSIVFRISVPGTRPLSGVPVTLARPLVGPTSPYTLRVSHHYLSLLVFVLLPPKSDKMRTKSINVKTIFFFLSLLIFYFIH